MVQAKWHFQEVDPRYKNREAMQGEFFSSGSTIKGLVREAIQNSLDAKSENSEDPVRIRIYYSGDTHALQSDDLAPFVSEVWPHYHAHGNGLKNCPSKDAKCKFLVIEDFNTTGLNGDIYEYQRPEDANQFYYFFRAEGQSSKSKKDRGRWGIGKFVFPRSSRTKTFFGLTIREEDKRKYLVGQAVLKSHQVNGSFFTPDGWFGYVHENGLPLPVNQTEDSELFHSFCQLFKLKRTIEPGLSIVIPYIDNEIDHAETVKAIIEDYFWPIMTSDLYVSVEGSEQEHEKIESGSLIKLASRFCEEQDSELKPKIELAKWASELRDAEFNILECPSCTAPAKWSEDLISDEMLIKIRKALEAEDKIAIRIPLMIREREKIEERTFFDVFMHRNPNAKTGMPVFIREGIIIPNVRCQKARGVTSLVIAQHPVAADFLGNAENPAHTEWHVNSENFKDKYIYGSAALRYIRNSVSNLLKIIDESSEQEDKTLLLDIFSIPFPSEGSRRPSKKPKTESGEYPEIPPQEIPSSSKPKPYCIGKIQGGFTIRPGENDFDLPLTLQVNVFYDRHGGKVKYSPYDFRLDKPPIKVIATGVKGNYINNRLKLDIVQKDFKVTVKGFDEKRDLLIKARLIKEDTADAKA